MYREVRAGLSVLLLASSVNQSIAQEVADPIREIDTLTQGISWSWRGSE